MRRRRLHAFPLRIKTHVQRVIIPGLFRGPRLALSAAEVTATTEATAAVTPGYHAAEQHQRLRKKTVTIFQTLNEQKKNLAGDSEIAKTLNVRAQREHIEVIRHF